MMEFNFLVSKGALERKDGRYLIHYDKMPSVLGALAKELLDIEATNN